MFKGGAEAITNLKEAGTLLEILLRAINDHGGGMWHLNRLLADAKGDRLIINKVAKMAIGRIWELVEIPVSAKDLGLTDESFDCSPIEFVKKFPSLALHPNIGLEKGYYSESRPARRCHYLLHHFDRPQLLGQVITSFDNNVMEHAGWREHLAYVSKLQPEDFSGCSILAGGSREKVRGLSTEEGTILTNTFPAAQGFVAGEFRKEGEVSVGWRSAKRLESDTFPVNCFWLVRVYE